jgi:hypothetical protein
MHPRFLFVKRRSQLTEEYVPKKLYVLSIGAARFCPDPASMTIMQEAKGDTTWRNNPIPECVSPTASTIPSACTWLSTPTTRAAASLASSPNRSTNALQGNCIGG